MNQKTVLITGASGGFGKAFTKRFLMDGYHVIATIRQEAKRDLVLDGLTQEEQENLTILILNVAEDHSIERFKIQLEKIKQIDVLINNAGFAMAGFAEELSIAEYKLQFETNFFGVIRVTNAVLPMMRKQGGGKIINISSISGLIGFPSLSPYVSSKHALEGYSESLRIEVQPFGIDVVLIEPGSFQTNIWTSGTHLAKMTNHPTSPYKSMFTSINERLQAEKSSYGDPLAVADVVVRVANSKRSPALRYKVGKGVKLSLFVKRLLPWKWWELLVRNQLKGKNK
ncbi:SDR family oxidoreductase [Sutcliffiella deserti]|uniref:SDR family oxidoreductase n=1 Tax=Sutcliffiella deserti TaxID=2875501 RepID=UPI001CBCE985|nr:SDR family oxidoreductase [Sutcliffiella deserti]